MSASSEVLATAATSAGGELPAAPGSLLAAGERVARRAAAPSTRSTYLDAYRHLAGFLAARLGRAPEVLDLTEEALLDFRDALEAAGRARTTVAKELSALRRLAAALEADGVDPAARRVRANAVGRRAPRALTRAELGRLLAMPDRRTRRGRRDVAIMLLLGQAGLRRAEVCALRYEDLEELRRHSAPAGVLRSRRERPREPPGSFTCATPSAGAPGRSTSRRRRSGHCEGGPKVAPRRRPITSSSLSRETARPRRSSHARSTSLSAPTPSGPDFPKTGGLLTFCATPSARSSPTAAKDSRSSRSSLATPTYGRRRATCPCRQSAARGRYSRRLAKN